MGWLDELQFLSFIQFFFKKRGMADSYTREIDAQPIPSLIFFKEPILYSTHIPRRQDDFIFFLVLLKEF